MCNFDFCITRANSKHQKAMKQQTIVFLFASFIFSYQTVLWCLGAMAWMAWLTIHGFGSVLQVTEVLRPCATRASIIYFVAQS
jgi:hypothetical protein